MLGGTEPAFVELLETLGEAVTIRDLHDRLVYANRAALRHLGFDTLAELQAHGLHAVMADYVVRDEHGHEVSMQEIPSVRLLAGAAAEPLLMQTVHRQTGVARWERLKTAALRDDDGQPYIAITVIEDLTAVKTAEVHMRVLSDSGRILATSLDLKPALAEMAAIAVPALADWCVIDLLDGAAVPHGRVAVAHRDPAGRAAAAGLLTKAGDDDGSDSLTGRIARTGVAELYPWLSAGELGELGGSPGQQRALRALDVRSMMLVPMRLRDRTLGVMTFGTSSPGRRLTGEDLEVAEQLAARVAVALETARLHATVSGVAATLAQSLLPRTPPAIPGWRIEALYRPAGEGQRIEVGGDFYEVFVTGNAALAVIGDVTGHGVTAATTTALLRHGARFASRLEPFPAAILRRLDEELRQRPDAALATALCLRIGGGELVLSSAGHPPALCVDRAGAVHEISTAGPLLGAFDDARWSEERVAVAPGDLVLLYTDGVLETAGGGERFGAARLKALLAAHAGQTPREVLAALEGALEDFRDGDAADDVAAVALAYSP